jgi:biotin carboxyl carrier protein
VKLKVEVAGEVFEVEIADLHSRPVKARIGEDVFDVWPEATPRRHASTPPPSLAIHQPANHRAANASAAAGPDVVVAPLPGLLLSVAVQPGDDVTPGQPLCVIEAMKMNNTVHAARAGRIGVVLAQVGQLVHHRQVILQFEPTAAAPA